MGRKIRQKHSNEFKLKVAIAVIKGDMTVAEMCNEFGVFGVSSSQIYDWKDQLLERSTAILQISEQLIQSKKRLISFITCLLKHQTIRVEKVLAI